MAKNKMKSHRGACKRMKLTGSGRLREIRHIRATFLLKRQLKRKRGLRKATTLTSADLKRMLRSMAK